jgi:hypothetical protein
VYCRWTEAQSGATGAAGCAVGLLAGAAGTADAGRGTALAGVFRLKLGIVFGLGVRWLVSCARF